MGPTEADVPFSLRNCSQSDPALQLKCSGAEASFPRLVFCCDGDMRPATDAAGSRMFGHGATLPTR